MGNLRRYYYANKAKIWRLLLIVAFILVIIQLLNYFQSKKVVNQGQLVQNGTDKVISNTSLSTDQSALGTGTVNEQKLKEDITIIDNFLNLCNNKKFKEAYEILSDECKECLFDTYDNFKNNYCDKIFNSYKMYTTENWSGNTYIVKIKEDPLASGNINNDTEIQEYITIVENGDKDKLNINNYIGRKKIEKENTQNDITIKVLSSDTFTEYEIYNIQVKNNTENTIYLDDGQDTSTLYIEDENNLKYEAASGDSKIPWARRIKNNRSAQRERERSQLPSKTALTVQMSSEKGAGLFLICICAMILTGDLGFVGSQLLRELMDREGYPLGKKHADCGLLIYDRETQDVHAGGSGCGCCASVLCSYILPAVKDGRIKNMLFIATGALLSTTSIQQGESIPGIAHLIHISSDDNTQTRPSSAGGM